MAKNKQSNLIVSVKMLNIGFIYKYIVNLGRRGGNSALVDYQSLLSKFFSLDPPIIFSIKYRLLHVSFIEP